MVFCFNSSYLNNFTYVKFAFALFQSQCAACNACIKFGIRFFNLHLQALVILRASPKWVLRCLLQHMNCSLLSRVVAFYASVTKIPFGNETNMSICNLYSFTFRHSSYQQGYQLWKAFWLHGFQKDYNLLSTPQFNIWNISYITSHYNLLFERQLIFNTIMFMWQSLEYLTKCYFICNFI